ncbi:hypothetical protein C7N83_04335 [Neisseria iguanae]|uniref:Transposase IS4-like domain-containing protein n=1 Tax=Neisseria iguanae TaxID=90242 RepID=A0A2P7U1K2_9NEIS|nr:hypothetical protein C7N83_04335 [Neisseria iguanae]
MRSFAVESERHIDDKVTKQTRLYIGSPEPAAVRIRQSVRSHWAVENPLHWCLDMWFAGDRMCLQEQYAAKNMHRLKQLALNLINRGKSVKRRISSRRLMAAGDDEFGSFCQGGEIHAIALYANVP